MKYAFFSAFLAVALLGCSKSKDDDKGGDDTSLFTGTIWSGEMTVNAHAHHEPYSLYFSTDSTVDWFHGSGQTGGKYKVENNKITITFAYYMWGPTVTADILSPTQLGNFVQDANENFTLVSCELNNTTGQQLLHTTWAGLYDNKTLQFVFKPNEKVQVTIDNQVYREEASYTTDLGYLAINTGADRFYGVLFGNTIKGMYAYAGQTYIPYTLTKQ